MNVSLPPMEYFELVTNFARELYHVDITALTTPDDIQGFCARHAFPPYQNHFAAASMTRLIADTSHEVILHMIDSFRLHKVLFFVGDIPVILGPFRPLVFSRREAEIILSENDMSEVPALEYLTYSGAYPSLSEKSAVAIVRAILHSLYPGEDDRPVENIAAKKIEAERLREDKERQDNYALRLAHRHACEKRFREYIANGNQRLALEELTRMERDVSYLKRIGNTLENEKIGAAVTRTTARLAAMDGGLPGIIAHEISSQNTKDTLLAHTLDEIAKAKEQMVRAYCSAVRKFKNESYSVFVQSVMYEMEHSYASDLNLDTIAHELAVSKNHLINRFRAEVGETPMQYLANLRLKRAASLLVEYDLSIQDVAVSVGIPDANYFTKLFKRAYGKTPLKYRKDLLL